jgi:intracellular sulfur oxidation DsrE/DsrF family protein
MKIQIVSILLLFSIAFNQDVFAQNKHRIIMQLTSNDINVHKGLTKQLNNLKNGWGDSVEIEVVCHGPGIDFITTEKSGFKEEINQLLKRGIVFVACENTMREKQIPKESIMIGMQFVQMGIGEIVVKQEIFYLD